MSTHHKFVDGVDRTQKTTSNRLQETKKPLARAVLVPREIIILANETSIKQQESAPRIMKFQNRSNPCHTDTNPSTKRRVHWTLELEHWRGNWKVETVSPKKFPDINLEVP